MRRYRVAVLQFHHQLHRCLRRSLHLYPNRLCRILPILLENQILLPAVQVQDLTDYIPMQCTGGKYFIMEKKEQRDKRNVSSRMMF